MAKATNEPAAAPAATASTTLTITVKGGLAPQPVIVTLYKDGINIFEKSYPGSSAIPFNSLADGKYDLYINGRNPLTANSSTICELSTDTITLLPTSDDNPDTENGKQYMVEYHFVPNN